MGLDLDKLRAWFDSEEGKASIEEYANKLAFQDVLKQKHINYIHERWGNNIDSLIQKVMVKYESDQYVCKEYKLGYEPRTPIYYLLYEYAEQFGEECHDEKYINGFTGGIYYLGSYVIQIMHGQGSVIHIDECKERIRDNKINKVIS